MLKRQVKQMRPKVFSQHWLTNVKRQWNSKDEQLWRTTFASKEKKSCNQVTHVMYHTMSQIQPHQEWRVASHDVWLGWLKWQILTAIQPPQLLRSVTWRVHTWRMFSLLPDNHSGTILHGPYTTKPIFTLFPTLLRIILHFLTSGDPDLMKIHKNKVYQSDWPTFTLHSYDTSEIICPSPQLYHGWVCHKQFSTVNAETRPAGNGHIWQAHSHLRKMKEAKVYWRIFSYYPHEASNLTCLLRWKRFFKWRILMIGNGGKAHDIDPEHVICCKQRSKASGFDSFIQSIHMKYLPD